MKRKYLFVLSVLLALVAQARERLWQIEASGHSIVRIVSPGHATADHIEMAGRRVAAVLRYGVASDGRFTLNRSMVWPMLRTVPNNTHASLMRRFTLDPIANLTVDGSLVTERVDTLRIDGTLTAVSTLLRYGRPVLRLVRTHFPSTTEAALIEGYRMENISASALRVELPATCQSLTTHPEAGTAGAYCLTYATEGHGAFTLRPGEVHEMSAALYGGVEGEKAFTWQYAAERAKRAALTEALTGSLVLETPDSVINEMFAFAKLRACESIYATKGGPLHGPGGESYYAAIWANDQAEYVNPFFPFTGYDYGNASALNSYRHFARFMNDEWRPLPSSIIAEGDDIWNGVGDRGDAAMIAYGAGRYALARGSREEATRLWPLIEWCLEYTRRRLNASGVPASDCDELEHRFPAGDANLCTASLYYDALLSAAYLAEDLGKGKSVAAGLRRRAAALAAAIDRHFAAHVEGFDTYRYYEGNDKLRAWICIPLTVGLNDRAEGTIDALLSPRLWTENGVLTQSGDNTFWDRSTLYALRGIYMAGYPDRVHRFMKAYSTKRLLGDHVPYAIEAWPEGGKRHLSAESGLYARVVTEGIFGIRPTGLRACSITPSLPAEWPQAALRHVRAFDADFDLTVQRIGRGRLRVTVTNGGRPVADKRIREGESITCHF